VACGDSGDRRVAERICTYMEVVNNPEKLSLTTKKASICGTTSIRMKEAASVMCLTLTAHGALPGTGHVDLCIEPCCHDLC
jgi:hypothetical protein